MGPLWHPTVALIIPLQILRCLQDQPDQSCEDPDSCKVSEDPRAYSAPTPTNHPSPSNQSGHHKGGQVSALYLSASSGRWRPLSQQEASQKRAHQRTLLEAVKLLSSSLSTLQRAELDPDSAPVLPNLAATICSTGFEHPAQSMSARAAPNSPMNEAGVTGAEPVKPVTRLPNQATPGQRAPGQGESLAAPILQGLCGPQELKGHVMTACQLVDPGMGYAGITAANTGMYPPHVHRQPSPF